MTQQQVIKRGRDTIILSYDFCAETAATLAVATRCGSWTRGVEMQRLAVQIAREIVRDGVRGLQAIAGRWHLQLQADNTWLHFHDHGLETGLVGVCPDSVAAIAEQLRATRERLAEKERRLSALFGREIYLEFADTDRVELIENPNYNF